MWFVDPRTRFWIGMFIVDVAFVAWKIVGNLECYSSWLIRVHFVVFSTPSGRRLGTHRSTKSMNGVGQLSIIGQS